MTIKRFSFQAYLHLLMPQLEVAIADFLPSIEARPQQIHEAMHYAMQKGGKRLRPLLCQMAYDSLCHPQNDHDPLPAAVAIECIHTYSLIHDDLPAMDNSPLRRGRPTCHIQFDEATAILAGDALLTHAFELLSEYYPPALAVALIQSLSQAANSRALIAGQMEDILSEKMAIQDQPTAESTLLFIHKGKTAALIQCSLAMGALLAESSKEVITQIQELGHAIGIGFQIADDLLDAVGDTETMGKLSGQDATSGKLTFLSLYGMEKAQSILKSYHAQALQLIDQLALPKPLWPEFIQSLFYRSK